MGMSASQARLLSLTSRLSDLEYRSQVISNDKMALARDSEAASDAYMDALDKETIKVKNDDTTNTYVTATAANLTTYDAISTLSQQRMLKTSSGQVIVSEAVAEAYESAKSSASVSNDSTSGESRDLQSAIITQGTSGTDNGSAQYSLYQTLYSMVDAGMIYTEGSTSTDKATYNYDGLVYTCDAKGATQVERDEAKTSFTNSLIQSQSYSQLLELMYDVDSDAYTNGISSIEGTTTTVAANEITSMLSGLSTGEEQFLNQFTDEDGNELTMCQGYRENTADNSFTTKPSNSAVSYYEEIFEQMEECGYQVVSDDNLNSSEWLYDQLNNGNIYLSEKTGKDDEGNKTWENISWSSGDSEITSETDDTDTAKAEAEYEKTTAEISAKDERFDLQLKNIDTEHNAVQTEIESVEKVINKNIERSFKMFDA